MKSKPEIRGTWSNPALRRCDPKRAFSTVRRAEGAAEKATKKDGELIIAYECPDCGLFHIGHADLAQKLARKTHQNRPCQFCGRQIPEFKREKAARYGSKALYCSGVCQSHAATARRRERRAAKES